MERLLDIPGNVLLGCISLLDSLPDYIRALLAALLLVAFLRFFEAKISSYEVQLGQSFRKTALVALILIPLLVWLFPSSRMVVFVEELALADHADRWYWLLLAGLWLAGAAVALLQLLRTCLQNVRATAALGVLEDDKLQSRLGHWQRRLGAGQALELVSCPGDRPRQLRSAHRIGFPAAAAHWPGSAQDVIIIHALAHVQKRHGRWHSIAQVVACLYWPITWVQTLHANLLQDFQRAADELAESCYGDRLGYRSALKQLTQRLSHPSNSRHDPRTARPRSRWHSGLDSGQGYLLRLRQLLSPQPEPPWDIEHLVAERESDPPLQWTDPYDKVVLFIGQAIFLAFLMTGITLKEKPPEADYDYTMPFELLWKEHFHRNLEIQEQMERNNK